MSNPIYISTVQVVKQKLSDNNYSIINERSIDYGTQITLLGGIKINIYTTGKIVIQGTKNEDLQLLLR